MVGGYPAGGSAALAELIDEYGEYIVADLLEYYTVDARGVFVEDSGITPRLLLALIRQLPASSRTVGVRRGGEEFIGWDMQQYMQAATVNALKELVFVTICANVDKPNRPKSLPEMIHPPQSRHGAVQAHSAPGSFAGIALAALNKKRNS